MTHNAYANDWIAQQSSSSRNYERPVRYVSGGAARFDLSFEDLELERLARLDDDWDGYGSLAPTKEIINSAWHWINRFKECLKARPIAWTKPYMGCDENGHIVLEWWKGGKKLTIYLSEANPVFLRIWGANMDSEMVFGEMNDAYDVVSPFNWLNR